ncbi:hypothetical protein GPX89_07720 [Nocardia sp. ET3-3]|uniref:Uncharacterized protein n=1 Tax=Nocardia terrae TaxID=2675851 RepID=A0A7K1US27_9NOCA|nr:hypothetical protein [Nocardia terrae]MVU77135.1 hypothetical protein [Nocardia terrae]
MNSRDRVYARDPRLPLSAVIARLDRIAEDVVPLSAEAAAALPESPVTWGRLAHLLLDTSVSFEVMDVDVVWQWLVAWARRQGDEAVLVCAGLAMPMLAATAARLAIRIDGERAEAEAAVLAGFVEEIPRINLRATRVWCALRWAAYRGGRAWEEAEAITTAPIPRQEAGIPAQRTDGDLETLLALAVVEGVIDAKDAALIADTRLGRRSLRSCKSEQANSNNWLVIRRKRAEARLGTWLRQRIGETESGHTSIVEAAALDSAAFALATEKKVSPATGISGSPGTSTGCARPSQVCAHPTHPEVKRCA